MRAADCNPFVGKTKVFSDSFKRAPPDGTPSQREPVCTLIGQDPACTVVAGGPIAGVQGGHHHAVVAGMDKLAAADINAHMADALIEEHQVCLLYTSPSPRDVEESRMPSSA